MSFYCSVLQMHINPKKKKKKITTLDIKPLSPPPPLSIVSICSLSTSPVVFQLPLLSQILSAIYGNIQGQH